MSYKPKTSDATKPVTSSGITDQEFLTATEAAEFLRIKKSHLYNLTSKRLVKFYQPQGKLMYFLKADLKDWILNNEKNSVNNLNSRNDGEL
jgi:excisionase family DNA binding protein